ncbi:hypothetical protein AERO8C_50478 [Aeromonas veronii]|uniref:Uncharacterized protein n=1 Tax=Aeromonas veronii TaxID=654 RepID=A0A653LA89_AERVE|nr:hypothetical protein AERO8C_50478 [Aeromonas veronii]
MMPAQAQPHKKDTLDVSNHFYQVTHHWRPGWRRGGGRRGADVPRPDRTGHGCLPHPGRT